MRRHEKGTRVKEREAKGEGSVGSVGRGRRRVRRARTSHVMDTLQGKESRWRGKEMEA